MYLPYYVVTVLNVSTILCCDSIECIYLSVLNASILCCDSIECIYYVVTVLNVSILCCDSIECIYHTML